MASNRPLFGSRKDSDFLPFLDQRLVRFHTAEATWQNRFNATRASIRNFRTPIIRVAEASTRSTDDAYLNQRADDYAAAV